MLIGDDITACIASVFLDTFEMNVATELLFKRADHAELI